MAARKAYEHSLALSAVVRALERVRAESAQADRALIQLGARNAFIELLGVKLRTPSAPSPPATRHIPGIFLPPRGEPATGAGDS